MEQVSTSIRSGRKGEVVAVSQRRGGERKRLVELAATAGRRVGHVHLKDVRADVATRLHTGELDLVKATRHGLFCALGEGDVRVAETVRTLESGGYTGWYVLEQDTTLETAEGDGPMEDSARSIAFLCRCLAEGEGGDSIG